MRDAVMMSDNLTCRIRDGVASESVKRRAHESEFRVAYAGSDLSLFLGTFGQVGVF